MKFIGRFVVFIVLLVLLISGALLFGFNGLLSSFVYPKLAADKGLEVQSDRASYNPFTGYLRLSDVEVANPIGFREPQLANLSLVEVKIKPSSLVGGGPIIVERVNIDRGVIQLIRNEEGLLNVVALQQQMGLEESGSGSGDTTMLVPVPAVKATTQPEILIQSVEINSDVRFVDRQLTDLDLMLHLAVLGQELGTVAGHEWGRIQVMGELLSDRGAFNTELSMKLAPVVDPQRPSFDLEGRIMEIDPRLIAEASRKLGVSFAPFGVDPQLICREGNLAGSEVAVRLHDVAFSLGGNPTKVKQLQFAVPVEGTIHAPKFEVTSALMQALGGNTRSLLGAALEGYVGELGLSEEPVKVLTDGVMEVLDKPLKGISKEAGAILEEGLNLFGGVLPGTGTTESASTNQHVEKAVEDLKEGLKGLGIKLF
tara:strand:- start:2277 stop:3554 length:1278 start_codon:yes stop_codon:yes gene_type:complete